MVICGGLLLGSGTSIIYIFAASAPFIAIEIMHLSPTLYGSYNFIPAIGILIGSLLSNYMAKIWQPATSLKLGLFISIIGAISLINCLHGMPTNPLSLFIPVIIIYLGFAFVFGNTAAIALQKAEDKSNASAMMSFTNMILAVSAVNLIGSFAMLQPIAVALVVTGLLIFAVLCFIILANKH